MDFGNLANGGERDLETTAQHGKSNTLLLPGNDAYFADSGVLYFCIRGWPVRLAERG